MRATAEKLRVVDCMDKVFTAMKMVQNTLVNFTLVKKRVKGV